MDVVVKIGKEVVITIATEVINCSVHMYSSMYLCINYAINSTLSSAK